jgi:hypothetical protein
MLARSGLPIRLKSVGRRLVLVVLSRNSIMTPMTLMIPMTPKRNV